MKPNLHDVAILTAKDLRNLSKALRCLQGSGLDNSCRAWRSALESHAADLERAAQPVEVSRIDTFQGGGDSMRTCPACGEDTQSYSFCSHCGAWFDVKA